MSNPTTPFNWQMPTSTDLVTDLPADFEVFGQAVASSMADLLGGTTGQILSKATNTDMDFVWIANDQGDITGVTATSPLTGGGTSGAITVGIQDASTTQKGSVQLSDSTSTTSSVLASTPTATKSAYDLANTANTAAGTAQTTANAAIPKSTVTTSGDVIYATGSSAVTRLGIGSTGQVLTVAAGVPSWATPSSGGSTFVGASVYRATPDQGIASGTFTAVNWTAENYDTDAFHDNTTNNTRLTIPTGKGGYYQIRSQVGMQGITGEFSLRVQKNGTNLRYFIGTGDTTDASQQINFATSLSAGDYITVDVLQSSGTTKNLFAGALYCWFECNYLGA